MADVPTDRRVKQGQEHNFGALNRLVADQGFERHLRFLNFGYGLLPGEAPVGPRLGPLFPNRESAQLLYQCTDGIELSGRTVVEVGCGRGGNLWMAGHQLGAGPLLGIDLARSSAGATTVALGGSGLGVQGDAEQLPLRTASVPVLLSIETSCTYPDLEGFVAEAARVTVAGGWLCWADLLPTALDQPWVRALGAAGFDVVHHRDITDNVLAARRARSGRQRAAFGPTATQAAGAMGEWLGAEDSTLARQLTSRARRYRIVRARRTDRETARALFTDGERATARAGAAELADLLALADG